VWQAAYPVIVHTVWRNYGDIAVVSLSDSENRLVRPYVPLKSLSVTQRNVRSRGKKLKKSTVLFAPRIAPPPAPLPPPPPPHHYHHHHHPHAHAHLHTFSADREQ
jgi:hypothetical protein